MISFTEHAGHYGLLIDRLIDDGRLHRVPTRDKPKKLNGAYIFDGVRGWVENHRTAPGTLFYYPPKGQEPKRLDAKQEAERRAQARRNAQAQEQKQWAAAEVAFQVVNGLEYDLHSYLVRKGFKTERALIDVGSRKLLQAQKDRGEDFPVYEPVDRIVVPMRDFKHDGMLSVQWISPDGDKLFLKGGRAKGAVFRLGNPSAWERWYCEGYATGLTLYNAAKKIGRDAQINVCFSASNLQMIALAEGGPRRFVMADHDAPNPQTGLKAGEHAARMTKLPWCQPEEALTDANDLMKAQGIWAVCDLMEQAQD